MNKYIRIMRLDHWIKQLFIIPGYVCGVFMTCTSIDELNVMTLSLGIIATCFIASANYVINEWLDAEFDKFHPTKKHRSVVEGGVKAKYVFVIWGGISVLGILLSFLIDVPFLVCELLLWIMGILYNVKPIRTKDIAFIDVISESLNNAIRFLLGWFIVTERFLPPSSIVLGYWMGGAFLMSVKRFSEYTAINDPVTAGLYRKSFKYYTKNSLLLSAFFYAMCSIWFIGIFLVKYKMELVLMMPFLVGIFCFYLYISFKEDSAAQRPEKLYQEKGLMIYCLLLIGVFCILMKIKIPSLNMFINSELIILK